MKLNSVKQVLGVTIIILLTMCYPYQRLKAQIWEPEGISMPGLWNGWTNPPVNVLALASSTQVPGGLVTKITSGTVRWHTTIKVAATGGDVIGGSYPFLFTSGPTSNPWQNTWKDVSVVMNTIQNYSYNGAADDQITVVNGKWYTANWQDNGYSATNAIFMETSGNPVDISTVSQSPLPGQVAVGQNVTVSITLSAAPCAEELFYLRYSNDGFTTTHLLPIIPTGTAGSAVIPATTGTVSYYIFSTTVANPTADYDMYALKVNNNAGTNYSFYYNTSNTNVTFRVNMSQQTVSPDGVHLVGDFQGWNTTATPMTNAGAGIYSVTLPLMSQSYQEYKFLNGNSYVGEETVPAACGADNGSGGFNRFITIPQSDSVLGAVCFSSCTACLPQVNVTFYVDMANETVSADGVHLAGDFQGWNPAGTPMTLLADKVYYTTVTLEANSVHQYKFINGITWDGKESVPATCGVDDGNGGYNRSVNVESTNMELPFVCFSSCSACAPPAELKNVTFKVNMSEQTVSPNGIHLVGDFQNWNPDTTEMTLMGNGIYTVTLPMGQGSYHEYKFINGTTWAEEESVPTECGVDDGNGGYNRFFTLSTNDTIMDAVCFASCAPCAAPPATSVVTFRVDMKEVIVSDSGVHLAGNFQGWDTHATPMTLIADGIYEVSVLINEGYLSQYKFINGNAWTDAEIVPSDCGMDDGNGGFNRFLTVPVSDTVTDAVCLNQCSVCHVGLPESPGAKLEVGKLWPNPSNDVCTINLNSPDKLNVKIRVLNSVGILVIPEVVSEIPSGSQMLRLDASHLIPGMYIVSMEIWMNGQKSVVNRCLIKK
ncbi:MAG: hypothetical protein HXX13_06645 [Bacteroidetes bacterium]|nr:hypothetical protein [Bacteroidota bacterium]